MSQTNTNDHADNFDRDDEHFQQDDEQDDPEAAPTFPAPSEAPREVLQGGPGGYDATGLEHQGVEPFPDVGEGWTFPDVGVFESMYPDYALPVFDPPDYGLLYPNDEPIVVDPAFDQALEAFQIEREAMAGEAEALLALWKDEAAFFLKQSDLLIPPPEE